MPPTINFQGGVCTNLINPIVINTNKQRDYTIARFTWGNLSIRNIVRAINLTHRGKKQRIFYKA